MSWPASLTHTRCEGTCSFLLMRLPPPPTTAPLPVSPCPPLKKCHLSGARNLGRAHPHLPQHSSWFSYGPSQTLSTLAIPSVLLNFASNQVSPNLQRSNSSPGGYLVHPSSPQPYLPSGCGTDTYGVNRWMKSLKSLSQHMLLQNQRISVPSPPTPNPSFQTLASQAAHPLVSVPLGLTVTLGQLSSSWVCRLPPCGWELPEAQLVSPVRRGTHSTSITMLIPLGIRRRGVVPLGAQRPSVPSLITKG